MINEGFEGAFPPTGWTKQSPDNGTGWDKVSTGTTPVPGFNGGTVTSCTDGLTAMAFCSYATGGTSPTVSNQWLITPQINSVGANFALNFWMRKFGNYIDNVKILVSTGGNAVADFTNTVATLNFAAADSGWINYNYPLSGYSGQNIYIAFNEYVSDNATDGAFISVDNVQVGQNASVNELTSKIYTNLYPIPTKENLNIEATNKINNIKVVNMVGKVVMDKVIDSKFSKLDLSNLTSGVYFLQMEFNEGIITKRFVKD